MRDTFLKSITDDQRNILYDVIEWNDKESSYRAKIILLKDEGYTVPEIRMATNHHDINIRKWIHRFNEKGIEGIISRKHIHKPIKISDNIEKKKLRWPQSRIQDCYQLPFSTWSLRRVLAGYISNKELNLVDSISYTEIRNIILKHGIRYRQSKVTF
ncbi:MAG TPA: helix-turn-helix domain-containing protein [Candidatus Nitrosocosmicus sp.]